MRRWVPAAAAAVLLSGAGAGPALADGEDSKDAGATTGPTGPKDTGGGVPALSIEVTDGLDGIEPGDVTEYSVTLRNDGEEKVEGVFLSQGLPPEMELVETDGERYDKPGGALEDLAVWTVDLKPGESTTGRTKARLSDPGEKVWRVAATACAQESEDSPPVVCATDANVIPRPPEPSASPAAAAAAATATESAPALGRTGGAILAGLVVGAGLVYFLWRWRRA
ncbi:hypothetical protein O4J56_26650 [Nocardiopsis sp. RSe5-2]|uniref:DUF11 domain-containing protein n=1 Tax=Nocardiopsis endophytica TaxID=3018445 RepID=A0ABT4UD72_9ACTN|nr:hypothetical protein [Nocardiopsis endophytica]MDA2814257.1 hypothetical protein [Nocardiopsis endophytica]